MMYSNYSNYKTDGTTIQMFPNASEATDIDKQIAVELIKATVELVKPSIKEGHLEEYICNKFRTVHETVISAYLGTIIQ